MHEIGHNLGLGHSGEGTSEYGDESGIMGNSYTESDTNMCFNNAKNWQLGWYSDRQLSIDPLVTSYWYGKLIGVVDYGSSTYGEYVILKIEAPDLDYDYYVGYNKQSDFNSDTREAGNEVTIQTRERGSTSKSWLVAELSEGESYTASGLFTLRFENKNSDSAEITIQGQGNNSPVFLCDPMVSLIYPDEVCVNTPEICEAAADLGANGKESCDAWCERYGLECVQAWNDGSQDCQKTSSISCSTTGKTNSICRCEKPLSSTPKTASPTPSPTPLPTSNPTRYPTKNPTRYPTKNPTTKPTKNDTPLCNPISDLISGNEICVNNFEVCEAAANLSANGKESCNEWCERSGLECTEAWNDGLSDCQKTSSISCATTGNGISICRCEKMGQPDNDDNEDNDDSSTNLCEPYLGRIWDNEVCSSNPQECEATADLNGESCDTWCERYGLGCVKAWDDGAFCERRNEIDCSDDGKSRSICLCEP